MAEVLAKRQSRRGSTPDARERELRRLRLSICDDVGFRLLVATYDQPKRRDALIRQLVRRCKAEKVRVTRLDLAEGGPETNLVGLLRAHIHDTDLPRGWRQAVMVTGIEKRIDYSSGREGYAFLHQANLLRDALPEAAPAPVVLWLSRMASAALPAEAPDLWDWRAASFDFTDDEAPRLELLRELKTLQPKADSGLSDEQRRARISMLEDLLAELEREGTPMTKRQAAERAVLLVDLGGQELLIGRTVGGIRHMQEGLDVIREIGDRRLEGLALHALGLGWVKRSEPQQAIDFFEQAVAIAREIGDRRLEGLALDALGLGWVKRSEPQQAIDSFERAVAIAREIGDRRGEGDALGNLGLARAALGEPRRAIEYFNEQLAIARETGDRSGEGDALCNLGLARAALGEPRRAIEYFNEDLAIAREIGGRMGEGNALGNLGNVWAALGEPRRAIEYFNEELAIAREIGDQWGEGNALFNSALALDALGERAEAVRRAREALAIFDAIGAKQRIEKARTQLAEWEADDAEANRASVNAP